MTAPLELGLRGMVEVEAGRVSRAADGLAEYLVTLLRALPDELEREALDALPRVLPTGLPPTEDAALSGRAAARALARASRANLLVFVSVCGEAGRLEAERLLPFADMLDVLLRASRASDAPTLVGRVQAAREHFVRLAGAGDTPGDAARTALAEALATDVGLPRAYALVQSGPSGDVSSRVHAAVRSLESPDTGRAALRRRAHLVLSPLTDLLDLHLDGLSSP